MQPEARAVVDACEDLIEALSRKRRDRVQGAMIKRLQADMAKAFTAQGKAFLAEWEKLKGLFQEAIRDDDWEPLWRKVAAKSLKLFTKPIDRETRKAIMSGAAEVLANGTVQIGWDLKSPEVVAFLDQRAADRVTKVNDTTKDRLKTIITKGRDDGLSHGEIASQIKAEFRAFAVGKPQAHIDSRAHLVAVTEIGDAYTEGTMQAAQRLHDMGLEQEKYWQTVGDGKVSDGCQENEGAGWIPLEDEFPSGDQQPLRFPGCRCSLLTRRKK